jgi:hypothetical protein
VAIASACGARAERVRRVRAPRATAGADCPARSGLVASRPLARNCPARSRLVTSRPPDRNRTGADRAMSRRWPRPLHSSLRDTGRTCSFGPLRGLRRLVLKARWGGGVAGPFHSIPGISCSPLRSDPWRFCCGRGPGVAGGLCLVSPRCRNGVRRSGRLRSRRAPSAGNPSSASSRTLPWACAPRMPRCCRVARGLTTRRALACPGSNGRPSPCTGGGRATSGASPSRWIEPASTWRRAS